MKKYRDLNLKSLREECDIDFAHYTFGSTQCSDLYGPRDMPARYWRDGKIATDSNYEYILFKNAIDGRGTVTRNDFITDKTGIIWNLSDIKLDKVCNALQRQLGEEYVVVKPESAWKCIIIRLKEKL